MNDWVQPELIAGAVTLTVVLVALVVLIVRDTVGRHRGGPGHRAG